MSSPLHRIVVVVAALSSASFLAACPPKSLLGQPCDKAGDEPCENNTLLRCDGQFYVLLSDCAAQCVDKAGLAEVAHNSASIAADETWNCEDGPHFVPATITVAAGATLTINPGALVRLNPASRIDVLPPARILSIGEASSPVLVTSKENLKPGFGSTGNGGINIFAAPGDETTASHVEFTIIEHGFEGLGVGNLSSDNFPPIVKNNTFRDNQEFGIFVGCGEANAPIPDFAADGNQFFGNELGDVSACPDTSGEGEGEGQ